MPGGRGPDDPVPAGEATQRLEHELEMVVALGDGAAVFGCALGVDLTRRDLQDFGIVMLVWLIANQSAGRRPWGAAKAFDARDAECAVRRCAAAGCRLKRRASMRPRSTAICGRAACWRTQRGFSRKLKDAQTRDADDNIFERRHPEAREVRSRRRRHLQSGTPAASGQSPSRAAATRARIA